MMLPASLIVVVVTLAVLSALYVGLFPAVGSIVAGTALALLVRL